MDKSFCFFFQKEGRLFFFEKKNQKIFADCIAYLPASAVRVSSAGTIGRLAPLYCRRGRNGPEHTRSIQWRMLVKTTLFAAVTALALTGGVAMAQTATDTTTTTQSATAPEPAPVSGTLSTTRTHDAVDAYGNRVDSKQSTYRNTNGVAEDTRTTTQTMAPPPPPVSSTTSTSTSETTDAPR